MPIDPKLLDPMDFDRDAEPVVVRFAYRQKAYYLVEVDTDTAVKWQNCQIRSLKMSGDNIVGMDGVNEQQVILLHGCIREADKAGNFPTPPAGRVAEGWVRALPYAVAKKLYERAKAISPALDERVGETLESLDERIAALQKRRDKIAAGSGDFLPKGSPGDTGDTSASPPGSESTSTK
jgi:hypothetical protein